MPSQGPSLQYEHLSNCRARELEPYSVGGIRVDFCIAADYRTYGFRRNESVLNLVVTLTGSTHRELGYSRQCFHLHSATAIARTNCENQPLTREVDRGCGRDGVADLVAHRCELASRLGALQKTSRKRRVSEGKRSRGKECGGRQSLTHGVNICTRTCGEGGSVEGE